MLYQSIDQLNTKIGKAVSWFILAMVLVQFIVVVQRYIFGLGSIRMQESIVYMHGMLFMIAAAYTYLNNGHVRVDIFYRPAPEKKKARIEFFGTLFFLIPLCLLIIYAAWPDVVQSWRIGEGSTEASGIHLRYILKSMMIIFPVLLILQGISTLIKSYIVLKGGSVADPNFLGEGQH